MDLLIKSLNMQKRGKMVKSKRAVSPLIATVLLIAFAVALGAVVMNWGRSYVETGAEDIETPHGAATAPISVCGGNVVIGVVKIGGKPSICYDSGENLLKYTIENKGTMTIDSVKFQVIGTNDIFNTKISTLAAADIKKSSVSYDLGKYGSIEQARFIPVVSSTPCTAKALSLEKIAACS